MPGIVRWVDQNGVDRNVLSIAFVSLDRHLSLTIGT
jgi:hypothetical protein